MQTVSILLLYSVQVKDEGNYTCYPIHAPKASVQVSVARREDGKALERTGSTGKSEKLEDQNSSVSLKGRSSLAWNNVFIIISVFQTRLYL
ncbi:hypothetical protein SK128_018658 [Halocaridina rubra]|uniref:Uncharacterized protein n=1 Tax=Halocaridina rubra TaxID=373956 RepID=A0AAN8ZS13_HALRR